MNKIRTINTDIIEKVIYQLCVEANTSLDKNIIKRFNDHKDNEVISDLLENAKIANENKVPICQDTGVVIVFLEIGQDIHMTGKSLKKAINNAVAKAYTDNYFRKSIVKDPLQRENTQDNTPAIIYTEIVTGDKIGITIMIKGGGSENKSTLKMLTPAANWGDIKKFTIDTIKKAGASACPPYVIGLGIGGTFDYVTILAKKALCRATGKKNSNKEIAKYEQDLLKDINNLPIGPAGFGGDPTALSVHIETAPCHIASLPVAVNIGCHANRHATRNF